MQRRTQKKSIEKKKRKTHTTVTDQTQKGWNLVGKQQAWASTCSRLQRDPEETRSFNNMVNKGKEKLENVYFS